MIKTLRTMLRDLLEEEKLGQNDNSTSTSTNIENEVKIGTGQYSGSPANDIPITAECVGGRSS
jgi:hypothetical protein